MECRYVNQSLRLEIALSTPFRHQQCLRMVSSKSNVQLGLQKLKNDYKSKHQLNLNGNPKWTQYQPFPFDKQLFPVWASLYLAEVHMWKGLSLLDESSFGFPLITMYDQNWAIPENINTRVQLSLHHYLPPPQCTFHCSMV